MLFPLTRHRPKPSVTFGGVYRMIDFALSNLVNGGMGRIRSVISPEVRVEPGALVERSAILEGATIGRGAVVRRAIVDRDVVIPEGATIGVNPVSDHRRYTVTPRGIVVVTGADVRR